jgi:hypothetical protein
VSFLDAVLKCAAQLHRERPDIYQSRHVQLALSIYKVRFSFGNDDTVNIWIALTCDDILFFAGQEGGQLCSIFSDSAFLVDPIFIRMYHVQARRVHEETCK